MTNLSCLSFGSLSSITSPGEGTLLSTESKLTLGGAARGTLSAEASSVSDLDLMRPSCS